MRYLVVLFMLFPATAMAQGGFFGGAAEGMQQSRGLELQRRALELDQRYRTNYYDELVRQQQLDDIERAIKENSRLLEEYRMRRYIGP